MSTKPNLVTFSYRITITIRCKDCSSSWHAVASCGPGDDPEVRLWQLYETECREHICVVQQLDLGYGS